jgi:hypothetical protein
MSPEAILPDALVTQAMYGCWNAAHTQRCSKLEEFIRQQAAPPMNAVS